MARNAGVMQASLATSPAQLFLLVVPGFLKSSTGCLVGLALVMVCILLLRPLEYALEQVQLD